MKKNEIPLKLPRVDELDGLRALLAFWVIICHILSWCGFMEARLPSRLMGVWAEFIGGSDPVQVFMILSGFAISFLLHSRHQSYGQFMTGRFFRIYPVYLVCLLLGILSTALVPFIVQTAPWSSTHYFDYARIHMAAEGSHFSAHLFAHLTLLNGLLPRQILPDSTATFLPTAWSITLEWQYYLVAPFIAICVRSGGGLLGVCLVSLLGMVYGHPWANSHLAFLPAQFPFFLIGIASYHLFAWFCRSGQPPSNRSVLPIAGFMAFGILTGWHHFVVIIWAICFGCVFVRGDDFFSRCLSFVRTVLLNPFLQLSGRMSYCIYLAHWPIILLFLFASLHFWPDLSANTMAAILIWVGVPFILIVSYALHRYIELPGMAWGKRVVASPAKIVSSSCRGGL